MANLTLKHLLDHGVSDTEWFDAHSAVATNPLYLVYACVCRAIARTLLALAYLPLLTIRQMPKPMQSICAREFYFHQWVDDFNHIRSAHYTVMFALARVIDSTRLAMEYGSFKVFSRHSHSCGENCNCKHNRDANTP